MSIAFAISSGFNPEKDEEDEESDYDSTLKLSVPKGVKIFKASGAKVFLSGVQTHVYNELEKAGIISLT